MNSYGGIQDAFKTFKEKFELEYVTSTSQSLQVYNRKTGKTDFYLIIEGSTYLPCPTLKIILENTKNAGFEANIKAYSKTFEWHYPLNKQDDKLGIHEHLNEINLLQEFMHIKNECSELREEYLRKYNKETEKKKLNSLLCKNKTHNKVIDKLFPDFEIYSKKQMELSAFLGSNPFEYDLKPGLIKVEINYGAYTDILDTGFGSIKTNLNSKFKPESCEEIPLTNPLITGIDENLQRVKVSIEQGLEELSIAAEPATEKTRYQMNIKNIKNNPDLTRLEDLMQIFRF